MSRRLHRRLATTCLLMALPLLEAGCAIGGYGGGYGYQSYGAGYYEPYGGGYGGWAPGYGVGPYRDGGWNRGRGWRMAPDRGRPGGFGHGGPRGRPGGGPRGGFHGGGGHDRGHGPGGH